MLDLDVPTTRAERTAVRRAWSAHPYRVRRQVVRVLENGGRHPDEEAARTAVAFAAVVLRPRGPHWWQDTGGSRYALPYLLAAALVLGATAAWLIAAPGSSTSGWLVLAFALLLGVYSTWFMTLYRQCDRVLAPWTPRGR